MNRLSSTGNTDILQLLGEDTAKEVSKGTPSSINISISDNSTNNFYPKEGGTVEMGAVNPKTQLTDLVFNKCDEKEKEEFLRELLDASVDSLRTNNPETLRQTLLDWEYSLLWKSDGSTPPSQKKEDNNGVNWREFISDLE